ncbi:MAG: hypothetical protein ACL93V_09985 [Candidatus Electrothrix sp. YB6]
MPCKIRGHKDEAVSAWIRDAAQHAEAVEDILMSEFRISRVLHPACGSGGIF